MAACVHSDLEPETEDMPGREILGIVSYEVMVGGGSPVTPPFACTHTRCVSEGEAMAWQCSEAGVRVWIVAHARELIVHHVLECALAPLVPTGSGVQATAPRDYEILVKAEYVMRDVLLFYLL